MEKEDEKKLSDALMLYDKGKKQKQVKLYRIAYDLFLDLYNKGLLNECHPRNAFLVCIKRINLNTARDIFEKSLEDVKSGRIIANRKDDTNHIKRTAINYFIENIKNYERARQLINEIQAEFSGDFQLYDLEAKLEANLGNIDRAIAIFDKKLSDWTMQKRSKGELGTEWDITHKNYYSILTHYIDDNFTSKASKWTEIEKFEHSKNLKRLIEKADEIKLSCPHVKNSWNDYVIGNARQLLVKYDKRDDGVIERNKIFISYARDDKGWLDKVLVFLKTFEDQELVIWTDRDIPPGTNFDEKIEYSLRSAKVGVLLITQKFLNSDYVMKKELTSMLDARREGLILIPLVCESCLYIDHPIIKLFKLQSFNDPEKEALENLDKPALNKMFVAVTRKISSMLGSEAGKRGQL